MSALISPADKVYTIFAGINGVGKTSLYEILKGSGELGERVNIDEIVLSMGSWRDTLIQIRAGRQAMAMINRYISAGVSFHQETTLPGNTIIKQIKRARRAGFFIRLYFIGIDDAGTAIQRVHKRMEKGGHGIDDKVILKRSAVISDNLKGILPFCDAVIFYDNTFRFRQIAVMKQGVLLDCDGDLPSWFQNIFGSVPADTISSFMPFSDNTEKADEEKADSPDMPTVCCSDK